MKIEFNAQKDQSNITKHGYSLDRAKDFEWDTAYITPSPRKDEKRFMALGFIDEILCSLVFTPREGAIRVISLRRASRKERMFYDEESKKGS